MKTNDCRWLDRYFGTVCRNMKTHPNMVHMDDGTTVFREPTCKRCDGCGYEPITPNTPAWDDGEDEAVGLPRLPDGRYIDILLRMLKPSELAAAHSFPKDYVLTGNRGEQVKQIGNSVPVMTAAAMCEADFKEDAPCS